MQFGFPTGKFDKTTIAALMERNLSISEGAIEISALRLYELTEVISQFEKAGDPEPPSGCHLSFHAPAKFTRSFEQSVIDALLQTRRPVPFVLHPDTVSDYEKWQVFGDRVMVENMDLRKRSGVTIESMGRWFNRLPKARWCFDVGHAKQVDPSLSLAREMLAAFGDRLAEIHMSVVDPDGKHGALTCEAAEEYCELLGDRNVPVILETILEVNSMRADLALCHDFWGVPTCRESQSC